MPLRPTGKEDVHNYGEISFESQTQILCEALGENGIYNPQSMKVTVK